MRFGTSLILLALAFVLTVLKVDGIIAMPWWAVLAPLWLPLVVMFVGGLIFTLIAAILIAIQN